MPALVDTGSPITVLNSAAASACAISSVSTKDSTQAGPAAGLPPALKTLSRVAANLKTSLEGAQAEARGDVLRMAGGDGRHATLTDSRTTTGAKIGGSMESLLVVLAVKGSG